MTPLNRLRFQRLAMARLNDARVLIRLRRASAAYYLAGYSVECALKACIARQTRRFDFPDKTRVLDSYTHDLERLARTAGLDMVSEISKDARFGDNWNTAKDWSEQSRYDVASDKDARELIRAISDPQHGVLKWLRERW